MDYKALFQKGVSYAKKSDIKNAIKQFKAAESLAFEAQDWKCCVKIKLEIVYCYYLTTKFNELHTLLNKLLDFHAQYIGEDDIDLANALNVKGLVYSKNRYYSKALSLIQESRAILQSLPEEQRRMDNYFESLIHVSVNVASMYGFLGVPAQQIHLLNNVIKSIEKNENHQILLKGIYNTVAWFYGNQGNLQSAIDYYYKAVILNKKFTPNDVNSICTILKNICVSHNNNGNYQSALAAIKEAIKYYKNSAFESKELEIELLNYLSRSYERCNQISNALDTLKQVAELIKDIPDKYKQEHLDEYYTYKGLCHLKQYKIDDAVNSMYAALAIRQQLGNYNRIANIYKHLSTAHLKGENFKETLECIKKGLNIFLANANAIQEAEALLHIPFTEVDISVAELLRLRSNVFYQLACSKSHKKEQLHYHELAYNSSEYCLRYIAKQFLKNTMPYNTVVKWITIAQDAFDNILRSSFYINQQTSNQHVLKETLSLLEHSKAIKLKKSLVKHHAKQTAQISEEDSRKELLLNNKIQEQKKLFRLLSLDLNNNQDVIVTLNKKIEKNEKLYKTLIDSWKKKYPKFKQLKDATDLIAVDEIQQCLTTDELIIRFIYAHQQYYAFIITNQAINVVKIAANNVNSLTIELNDKIINIQRKKFIYYCNQLSKHLLADLLPYLKDHKNLIILADNQLFNLPFDVLFYQSANENEKSLDQLPYFIKQYNTRYQYSLSVWLQQRKNRIQIHNKQSKPTFDYVGCAPDYERLYNTHTYKNTLQQIQSIPNKHSNMSKPNRNPVQQLTNGNPTFSALPNAAIEIKKINALIKDSMADSKTKVLLNTEVSSQAFLQYASNSTYIHLAAHSYINGQSQEQEIVCFPFSNTDSQGNFDKIELKDIYNLSLQAKLVVLNACESGIGSLEQCEGMISMNRAFLLAGAQNVVFTLYKISDSKSLKLISYFFEAIIKDQQNNTKPNDFASALRTAKLQLIKDPKIFPKFWAAFLILSN